MDLLIITLSLLIISKKGGVPILLRKSMMLEKKVNYFVTTGLFSL